MARLAANADDVSLVRPAVRRNQTVYHLTNAAPLLLDCVEGKNVVSVVAQDPAAKPHVRGGAAGAAARSARLAASLATFAVPAADWFATLATGGPVVCLHSARSATDGFLSRQCNRMQQLVGLLYVGTHQAVYADSEGILVVR